MAHPGCWSRIFPYAIYRNSMLYSCYLFDSTKTGAFVWLDDLSLFKAAFTWECVFFQRHWYLYIAVHLYNGLVNSVKFFGFKIVLPYVYAETEKFCK